ncbi:hypothetical protein GZ22_03185 [Terribacillus saccharophilus]|uniref:Peptidase M50 domain-containing protein n=1 Tax=Terribacillus saccharophilus TaxID=361277 RepID=A0A075LIJ5_9BACI|nr:hypothetical protein GZ22_03185 [Terribacillus goriensis]
MISFLLFYVFVPPVCLLLHEFGHGIAVILSSKSHARIYLGRSNEENKRNFSIGRLHFHIHWAFIGFCSWDGNLNKRQRIIALAGGPIMSFLLICLLIFLKQEVSQIAIHPLINGAILCNIIVFAGSVMPFPYPRWSGSLGNYPSDGLQLLRILRER